MATWLQNFELGAAGLADYATAVVVPGSKPGAYHLAAHVYTSQTATTGADSAETQAIYELAAADEDAGALNLAAENTVEQVGEKVQSGMKVGVVVLVVALVVGAAAGGIYLARKAA